MVEQYLVSVSGRWMPVQNAVEIASGWLRYGHTSQGRAKAGNWMKQALKPAPRLAPEKPRLIPRAKSDPRLLRDGSQRCFCVRCELYFRDEAAFTAHHIPLRFEGLSRCASDDSERRGAGLRTYPIRGSNTLEWGL